MQELIANVDHLKFDLEIAVEQQLGAQPLPFPGMDSKLMGALMNICFTFSMFFFLSDLLLLNIQFRLLIMLEIFSCTESGAAVCEFFMRAACMKGMYSKSCFKVLTCNSDYCFDPTVQLSLLTGGMCPFRHISGEKTVVCKHWLRGLCKKGDQCEFLHEYDMTKMPECYFYSKFG